MRNGVSENAGVNSPFYTPSNNTDANLSDYTLSFDLAITHGANTGFSVYLNIFGTGAADGSSYTVPISQITVGGGFQHFSVNMGTLPTGYKIPALVPTDSQYSFQLLFIGTPSVTATPETILLDNLQIMVVSNTYPYPTPPPSGTNTAGPYYVNPPIYADYPDPDIIRVGNDFYFSTTTFIDVPGLTILHSQDLVHWEIVTHLIPQLTGSPNYNITNGVQNYRNGVFASSIRYYNGTFYVVDQPNGQPNATIFYSTNIAGPWQANVLNMGAFDPGLYIETNGTGYIVTAGGWQSNTTILTLNSTFSSVVATTTFANGLGLEGSHVVKVGGYYYIFNSQPATGNFYISRATSLFGPYTFMYSMNNNNGGHQGAIVDMPDGSYCGFVMKDSGAIGRMTYISPIFWTNGWPVFGTANAPGQVPATAPMPIVGAPAYKIATSDDFSSPTLGLQWQFNHNPDNTRWSLTARPGFLRLHPTGATNFWYARNTLIQKGQGPSSGAEVKFDLSNLQSGDTCGLGTLGKTNGNIAVKCNSPGNFTLSMNLIVPIDTTDTNLATTTVATAPFTGTTIFLRLGMDYYCSVDTFLHMSPDYANKYDRTGPEIFVGEWAAYETSFPPWDKRSQKEPPTPDLRAAIGDSVFMAAMERNSDLIKMQCYAPLFVNVNPGARRWRPDLIGYDALSAYGSPSYYALQMFSRNLGDEILSATSHETAIQGSATRDSRTGEIILKLVNPQPTAEPLNIEIKGVTSLASKASAITLAGSPEDTNSISHPRNVVPVSTMVRHVKPQFFYTLPPNSIVVLKLEV